jgi:hypothetical protein
VELKNGVTFNGHLVECDNFMNVTLREVYQTSADGEKFWKMKEMFIKGNIVSLSTITRILKSPASCLVPLRSMPLGLRCLLLFSGGNC